MSVAVDDFRTAHESLRIQTEALRRAAREVPHLSRLDRAAVRDAVLDFLERDVEMHTKLDERLLRSEADDRHGAPLATVSMAYDHLAIRRWIDDIAAADPANPDRLQELLYGLDALMRVHLWKESALELSAAEGVGRSTGP